MKLKKRFMGKSSKKTIGIVLPYLKARGTEKQALRLAKGFIEKKFNVILFVVQGWGIDFMYQEFGKTGVKVINVGKPKNVGRKKVNFSRIVSLVFLIKKYKCDLLLSRAGMTNKICGLAGRISFVPVIIVFSGSIGKSFSKNKENSLTECVKKIIFLFNIGFPSFIVAVSSVGADNLVSNYPFLSGKVINIYNGVENKLEINNLFKYYPKKKNHFSLCYAGSLEIERKGLDILIQALYRLVYFYKETGIELLLIGDGEDKIALKKEIKKKKLEKNVILKGEYKNPYSVIANSDIFILPSRREGFPNSLLEAMSLGVCCISADCETGPNEIIENNIDGILFPVGNSKKLAEKIKRLKDNKLLRRQLSVKGQRKIRDKFNFKNMIENYVQLINKVIKK
jgi:GalNAc-alpha-(1->4)-GalNAc-alpha-(1->3)-diNAcBac-PP-undecaprenol alpha-1,4-N-acetyl-D-galactosaminyltransferase